MKIPEKIQIKENNVDESNHLHFLIAVKAYVKKHPDVTSDLILAMTKGVEEYVNTGFTARANAYSIASFLITNPKTAMKMNKYCNRKMWEPEIVKIIDEHLPKELKGKQYKS